MIEPTLPAGTIVVVLGFQGGDDQFASTEGAYIQISGGVLYVNASGDGMIPRETS
ncbi:MAG: hypothetical protein V8S55_09150 [Mediterraneibacter faecis]